MWTVIENTVARSYQTITNPQRYHHAHVFGNDATTPMCLNVNVVELDIT